ncbi:MAG: Rap1a/Tai family immunity protein [Hyphomicrobiales bacterium]|uniref:Rap1a/Tai family immunity protein n=1 Tax=Aestuariivirga sp. TaxID=2650926 RepID=UPI0035B1C208
MDTSKPIFLAVLAALALLTSGPAQSGFLTGEELLHSCSPQPVDPVYRLKMAECRGYVVAVADTSDCSRQNSEFKWNSSTGASQRDLVVTVVDWLHAHPELLHFQADGLVAAALSETFPCNSVTASGQ